ncbi:MAG: hypothetical protein ACOZDD_00145 [Bacteroidota bacterium]
MNLPASLKRLHPVFYGKPESPPVLANHPVNLRNASCKNPAAPAFKPDRRHPQTGLPPETRSISEQL